VPPPPVAGAPAGTGRADWVAGTDCVTVAVTLGLGVMVLVTVLLTVAEPLAPGENEGGVNDGEDPEQAATEAEAIMARAAQPKAVLSPAATLAMGTLMGSPQASGRGRAHFWVPVLEGHKAVLARRCEWPAHH
jgi:hypothetical protein